VASIPYYTVSLHITNKEQRNKLTETTFLPHLQHQTGEQRQLLEDPATITMATKNLLYKTSGHNRGRQDIIAMITTEAATQQEHLNNSIRHRRQTKVNILQDHQDIQE
jgi:hypothetical protein